MRGARRGSAAASSRIGEPDYPQTLQAIDTAPPLLARARATAAVLRRPAVAIVGARNASAAGLKLRRAPRAASSARPASSIVSGLARGIDAARPSRRRSRPARSRCSPAGSTGSTRPRTSRLLEQHRRRGRRRRLRDAVRLGAARPRLSRAATASSPACRSGSSWSRRRARSGSLITARFAARAGPRGLRRPGLAARSARRRHERPDPARRDAVRRAGACHRRPGAAPPSNEVPRRTRRGARRRPDEELGPLLGRARPRLARAPSRSRARRCSSRRRRSRSRRTRPASSSGFSARRRSRRTSLPDQSGLSIRAVNGILLELELAGRLVRHAGSGVSLNA